MPIQELLDIKDVRINKLRIEDRAFHDWYRFVLSFPPHLVRNYIEKFELTSYDTLLDPFCGTGTTLVEAKKMNIESIGVEANPMAYFASNVKTEWSVSPHKLLIHAERIYSKCISLDNNSRKELKRLTEEQGKLILKESINPIPLHKCIILYEEINKTQDLNIKNLELLALAHVCVNTASNLKFGPEVYVSKDRKTDAQVFENWLDRIKLVSDDLEKYGNLYRSKAQCVLQDARNLGCILGRKSISAVITSPPYPNEKDYTRTTRLESTLLGLIKSKSELRSLKQNLIRSNTRNVFVRDTDDEILGKNIKINKIADEIERRRIALNKTSGFEKLYHRVTKLYFGGMKKHLEDLKPALRRGAKLAYVVGDQASYLQVLIKTGELLADIADELGYNVIGLDLFRARFSTVTGKYLKEEVVLLEWNGGR